MSTRRIATVSSRSRSPSRSRDRARASRSRSRERSRSRDGEPEVRKAADSSRPQAYFKTKLCLLFSKGNCSRGNRCSFAHGDEELRGSQFARRDHAHPSGDRRDTPVDARGRDAPARVREQDNVRCPPGTDASASADRQHSASRRRSPSPNHRRSPGSMRSRSAERRRSPPQSTSADGKVTVTLHLQNERRTSRQPADMVLGKLLVEAAGDLTRELKGIVGVSVEGTVLGLHERLTMPNAHLYPV